MGASILFNSCKVEKADDRSCRCSSCEAKREQTKVLLMDRLDWELPVKAVVGQVCRSALEELGADAASSDIKVVSMMVIFPLPCHTVLRVSFPWKR